MSNRLIIERQVGSNPPGVTKFNAGMAVLAVRKGFKIPRRVSSCGFDSHYPHQIQGSRRCRVMRHDRDREHRFESDTVHQTLVTCVPTRIYFTSCLSATTRVVYSEEKHCDKCEQTALEGILQLEAARTLCGVEEWFWNHKPWKRAQQLQNQW